MITRAALVLALALSACRTQVDPVPTSNLSTTEANVVRAELVQRMTESKDAWNRADLAGHLALYTDSATMMSATGPRGGRDEIGRMLTRGFWEGGRPKAQLEFSDLAVTPLGRDHAMMTGAFLLTYPDARTANGRYTLVWRRTPDGWRIIHDHSS